MPLLLLAVVPLVELWLLIQVGTWIGALPTLLLCLGSALLGVMLVRRQGFAVLGRLGSAVGQGTPIAKDLLEGVLLLCAGLLLLIPGFLTDLLGLGLLVPPLRRDLIRRALRRLVVQEAQIQEGRAPPRVIEGEYRREPD